MPSFLLLAILFGLYAEYALTDQAAEGHASDIPQGTLAEGS